MREPVIAFFPCAQGDNNPYQHLILAELEKLGYRVVQIPNRKIFPLLQFQRHKPDIIHIFWPFDMYIGKNRITAFFKQCMFLLTVNQIRKNNCVYAADNLYSHNGLDITFERKWLSRLIDRCKGIIITTEAANTLFRTVYPNAPAPTCFVPSVSYMDIYPNTIERSAARSRFGYSETHHIFLSLGRVEKYKNIDMTIAAYKQMRTENTRLLIAGKCSDLSYAELLKKAIRDDSDITWHNAFVAENDLQVYYNAADWVICNYSDIALNPGTVMMALGFNKKVIAPDTPVIRDFIPERYRSLFKPLNIDDMAIALSNTITETQHYGDPAPFIRINNSAVRIAEKLSVFYQELLQSNAKHGNA